MAVLEHVTVPRPTQRARRLLVAQVQRASRRLDSRYLELFYQTSYLDLARRTPWLEDVPLASPSGGTASFSQLYALLTALGTQRPERVLELGVGLSTRLLTQYADAHGAETVHVDESADWLAACGVAGLHAPLRQTSVDGREIQWYGRRPAGRFDLVLVDGPESWDRPRRFNRLGFATWTDLLADECVVLVDDTSRRGERALVDALLARRPDLGARELTGANSQTLLATPRHAALLYI